MCCAARQAGIITPMQALDACIADKQLPERLVEFLNVAKKVPDGHLTVEKLLHECKVAENHAQSIGIMTREILDAEQARSTPLWCSRTPSPFHTTPFFSAHSLPPSSLCLHVYPPSFSSHPGLPLCTPPIPLFEPLVTLALPLCFPSSPLPTPLALSLPFTCPSIMRRIRTRSYRSLPA